jgi:purine-nucleoside phosphorylase
MPTAHISADEGDFAPDLIMPGDPYRAKRIADTYLTDARLVTEVRGILGYTGSYEGRPLSVMASGMGMPSATIYATELARFYGVKRIVRVGTAGGLLPEVRLRDIVVATGAHTDSAMSIGRIPGAHFSHIASYQLVEPALQTAATMRDADGVGSIHVGTVFSTDSFYLSRPATNAGLVAHGVLAVEMEAAGLYAVAAAEGIQALAVMTVTDRIGDHEELSADDRERGFGRALQVALGALK